MIATYIGDVSDGNCACLRNIEIDLEKGCLLGKAFPCSSYTKGQSRSATIQGSQGNLRCAARSVLGPLLFLV